MKFNQGQQRKIAGFRGLSGIDSPRGLSLLVILCLFLNSCTFGLLEGYRKTDQVSPAPVSWFRTDADHLLLNTAIDVMKNHFSGLMVIKSLPDGGFRVVFITEVGMKIFDLELIPGEKVKVHYFMDALNKKILVRTLSGDLEFMLVLPPENEKPIVYDGPSAHKIVRFKHKRIRDYYEISPVTGKPFKAWKLSGTSKKAVVDYHSSDGVQIDSVNIVHYHVNLRIGMQLINENSPDAVK
jgi:hypothetical protein